MRVTTSKIIAAFLCGRERKYGYDEVKFRVGDTYLSYRGNTIAKRDESGQVSITDAGWPTVTTKDRLNGIPGVSISQKKGVWYLNGAQWDGKWIKI